MPIWQNVTFQRSIKSVRQVYVVVSVSITHRKYSCSEQFMLQLIQFSMGHEKFLVYVWHKLLIFLSLNSSFDIKSARGVLYMHSKH